ncbi:hypothetical protein QNK01_11710 (plasmid) [Desemzia incerta]|uniref:hypothetical protein n=1 Tax=Desemzia incerta TaxID=82801 RepID=UPI0024C42A77|nr:hypothetical protein [Desemzia incerta]WHZ33246.1 hypothetical protein QNK01_11710 [Desemzia incerta]
MHDKKKVGINMTYEEKARIILEKMDKFIQINWNMEKYYLQGIVDGLKEIDLKEKEKKA